MSLWTAARAEQATGGRAVGAWEVTGISIDTRTLEDGDLFVALKDSRDGHDFVADALAKGAGAAMVSRIPDGVSPEAPLLVVEDVLEGLEGLARAARMRTKAKVIGITGSVGKTSTKEMLRTCLTGQGRVHAAEKSFNNHWGVPLTLARMPQDTDFAIIEIGMNHPGEIAPLARLADLDIALITTVAPAHLEAFDDIAGIAREKASIFEGLREDGKAIVNVDLEVSPILTAAAGVDRCIGFGQDAGADWCLNHLELFAESTVCKASHQGETLLYKIATPGHHFAMNGLGALAVCEAAGADLGQAVLALAQWHPPAGRGKRHLITLDPVDPRLSIDLIDDAYNANPASVGAALDVLSTCAPLHPRGNRVAILGDMRELGRTEAELHAALAEHPAIAEIDTVHCVGDLMRHLYDKLPNEKRGAWAEHSDILAASPSKLAHAGDVVLVKGSLSMKMAEIVDAVAKLGQATEN